MKFLVGLLLFLLTASEANAITCGPVPYTFVPGTTIQSGQVNSNFSALQSCISGVAGSGTNADINILNGTGSGVAVFGAPTNSNAGAGYVGEYISSDVLPGNSVTISGVTTITSVSLTAGDWDCSGQLSANTIPGSGASSWLGFLNTSVATGFPNWEQHGTTDIPIPSNLSPQMVVGPVRYSLSSPTTVYLLSTGAFTGTLTVYGFERCRRMR